MLEFYRGKRVLITGHTGFKGAWLSLLLAESGANVTGYALPPAAQPNLFEIIGLDKRIVSVYGDIRDYSALKDAFDQSEPEIVLHLAAQPIVREGYRDPRGTYETNVMGTVNLMDCIRLNACVRSVVNITTDKVYRNVGKTAGYQEDDMLGGGDPYANSKSCSELVTDSYRRSFFSQSGVAVSTARAGNVIGGGDFAADRILPDCIRAAIDGKAILIRNPDSIRPYQHVLDALYAYLMIAEKQHSDIQFEDSYNIGPAEEDCLSTGNLATVFCEEWGNGLRWEYAPDGGPHEDKVLKLDSTKLSARFNWHPKWNAERAVRETVLWTKAWRNGEDMANYMLRQATNFEEE